MLLNFLCEEYTSKPPLLLPLYAVTGKFSSKFKQKMNEKELAKC